jgi:rod shape-determining protein MreB
VKYLLDRTPPELSSDVADRGLMLVGGGALLRFRRAAPTRDAVSIAEDPLTTVGRGAGQALEELETLPSRRRRGRRGKRRFGG